MWTALENKILGIKVLEKWFESNLLRPLFYLTRHTLELLLFLLTVYIAHCLCPLRMRRHYACAEQ